MFFTQLHRPHRGKRRDRKPAALALRAAALLLVHLTLGFTLARAVDPPHNDVTDLSLEELGKVQVYSASMYLQDDRKAPSSVTVVTADEIRKCGYRTLADILRNVRGFYVSYDRNYSYVGVRGFSRPGDYNTRILLLLNGHRLTDNLYNSALIGTEFQLDVDLIDRVEIIRGPSSSLYGTNAFLAVVNVITRNGQKLQGLELAGEADGFGTYRGRATYGQQIHGIGVFLSGTGYDSAGAPRLFFPAYDSPLTNNGYVLHADHDSSKSYMGQLTFGHFTLESVASTREKQIPTASFGTVFGDPRSQTVDDRGYLDLKYERTLQKDTEFMLRIYVDRVSYHGVYVYEPDGGTGNQLNQDLGRGEWAGIKTKITKPLWRKHKVTVGGTFLDDLRQDQSNYGSNPYSLNLDDDRSSKEWAILAQDEFSITHRLTLNAGVRHDQYYTFGGTTNPRLALIYSPLARTTFKLMYGRAFRAPNTYELYYQDGSSQESNPTLRPEKIATSELVWEQDLGARFRFTADGFDNHIADLINQQTDPANGFLFFANVGKARGRGVELELAGRTLGGIEGRVSYSFQRSLDSVTETALTNSPQHLAKAEITLPLIHRRLFVGSDFQYMSSRGTLIGSEVRPFEVVDLTVSSREFAGGFQFSASVYNLFNRIYSDPVGAEIQSTTLAQNGRDFRIKLSRVFHFK
jgi:outer membrane receptor for ferrienterochelin and colicins